jgi:acetyl esterase/lipase
MGAVIDALELARSNAKSDGPCSDPRTRPELARVLAEFGLGAKAADPELDHDDFDAVYRWVGEAHDGFEGLYEALPNELPGDDAVAVDRMVTSVPAPDGHQIELHVYRPRDATGKLPGVVYYHGGGMTILSPFNKVHRRWCYDIAAAGTVAIGVGFRNAHGGEEGVQPFPLGLHDCLAALRWVDDSREELGIGKLVVLGESGGANLALATTLLAKREGEIGRIDGVYAPVPYISGAYGWDAERRARELPSLIELDGYLMSGIGNSLLAIAYDPGKENAENPLAWPYFATVEELVGMPPHVITVNELDPLKDEGIAYLRKLQQAGVPTVGRVNLGLIHAAEMIFRQTVPEDYFAAVGDIHRFASSL